jgi:para-nitrobenzyl esterase
MSDLLVQTVHGAVRGAMRGGVAVWRGIPYAAAPVGRLRFRPPQPPAAWAGERDATRFAPVAIQSRDPRTSMMSGIGPRVAMSEDCLAVNVFSPAADGRRRPVVVWVHGGAFLLGSGSTPLYDGASFAARHDIVVVTFNYRLGLLGLLYLGDLAGDDYAAGNCALLDQIAALGWVRDNIAGFGGDPGAVTLMGQSAGAIAIGALLAMPGARGLFHRAILQSGASGLGVPSRADATATAARALADLGVDAVDPDRLAAIPIEAMLEVQEKMSRRRGLGAFAPYVDGVSLPAEPIELMRTGQGAQVPLLLGTNRDEWALFDLFMGDAAAEAVMGQIRNGRLGSAFDQIHATYRDTASDGTPARIRVDMAGDVAFRIPVVRLAEAQVAQGLPVWMYRFDWATPAFDGRLGAGHAVELPFTWNAFDLPFSQLLLGGGGATAQPLATRMHDAWAAFIRAGDPNGAGLPAWPPYEPARRATMILDLSSRVEDDPDAARRAVWPV